MQRNDQNFTANLKEEGESLTTSVSAGSIEGIDKDPIGLKVRAAGSYKKENEATTLKKLKEKLK